MLLVAAGRDDATAAVRHEAHALLAQLSAAVQGFQARQVHGLDALTDDVARFAFATVEAILDHELAVAASPVRDAIERALRLAPDRLDAIVLLHPDDVERLGPIDDLAGGRGVEVVTDSQYVAKGSLEWMPGWKRNGWRRKEGNQWKPVKNVELWQRLDELLARHDVRFTVVRGHTGHPENERCDELAVAASLQFRNGDGSAGGE